MQNLPKLSYGAAMIALCLIPFSARADLTAAEELGFQAGAMEYCRDNFPADQKTRKQYDALRSVHVQELQQLPESERKRALEVASMVGRKGNIGAKKLSAGRCDQLRQSALAKQLQGR